MKINRLIEITTILLNRGMVTARELADRFDVSTRTIYRDIDVLSAAGIPVYMNKGKGGGIALTENYTVNRMLISEQERDSLLLAVKMLQATQYPQIDQVLQKLGLIVQNTPYNERIEIDFSYWGSKPNENNKFHDIKKAMLQCHVIRFAYVDVNGNKSNRLVEPAKLIFKGSSWYLLAYCQQQQGHRIFRISRLKDVEIMLDKFEHKPLLEPDAKATQNSSKPFIQLKLWFDSRVLNRLYDSFDEDYITKMADGSFVVDVAFPEDEWVYGYILSFGSFVEVLEPGHIRQIVADRMKQALKLYEL